VPLGLVAGYSRRFGELVMRLVDVQLSVPTFLIALVVLALWGAGLLKLILVIGVVGWAAYARLVRGAVLSEREREYVLAAEALGMPTRRILFRHILPNVLSVILVQVSVDVPRVILLEATLSFLGVGVSIETPSIGLMVKRGMDYLFSGVWWTTALPGLALMLLVLTTNLLGDWTRDAFDPRRKRVQR
jgi:peptide/nickel transport system permease protein